MPHAYSMGTKDAGDADRAGYARTGIASSVEERNLPSRQKREGRRGSFIKLKPNYIGHTLTNRFGHGSLPKTAYSDAAIFEKYMESAVDESLFMATHGVQHKRSGETFYMITLPHGAGVPILFCVPINSVACCELQKIHSSKNQKLTDVC